MIGLLLSASVLILVIVALRRILRGKIRLRVQYALWLLVALRLLIPVEFGSSPLSLQNFVSREESKTTVVAAPGTSSMQDSVTPPVSVPPPTLPAEDMAPIPSVSSPAVTDPSQSSHPSRPSLPHEPPSQKQSLNPTHIITLVWALGAGAMALWFLGVNLRFRRKARRSARPLEVETYPFPVFVNESLPSPCLVGLLWPRVYLPYQADRTTLHHILVHEQTHRRHWDPLWAGVRALCLCLYWFHPLVWWAAVLSRQDCELACDEGALRQLGEEERIPYGDTLLTMVRQASRPHSLLQTATTMSESKKQLKERMEMIVKQPKKLWFALLSLVLVLALAVGCTFTGANREDFISPTSWWCSSFQNLYSRWGGDTYQGDIESLQRTTDLVSEKLDALETLDPQSQAYALLENTLQIGDLLEKEGGDSFFDLPEWEQEAILELWYILGNTNNADSEEEYLRILEAHAGSWLDPWIFGSSGYILPIENPILPPSMPPKETTEPTTESDPPTEEFSLDAFVEPYYEKDPYRIPAFTQAVASFEAINKKISEIFASVTEGDNPKYTAVDYECYQNGNILSLLIIGERGTSAPLYESYNIDITTGDTADIWDAGETEWIVPLMLVKDLTEEYTKTGTFPLSENAHDILKKNLYFHWSQEDWDHSCLWLDEAGKTQYSFCYYPPDGGEPLRHILCVDDYRAPENPWTGAPQVAELLTFDGYGLPEGGKELCHIPFLLMPGPRAMEINAEVLRQYCLGFGFCEYSWTVNGDICSFLVHGIRDFDEYSIYNLSYSQGTEYSPEDVYTALGYSEESYMEAAKKAIQNYFFARLEGTNTPFPKETYDYLAAASGGASNVTLSRPYLDEKGNLWILGRLFQIAGASYSWHPIPMEGLPLSQGYRDFLSLPRTELTLTPDFNLMGYTIESLPAGNPLAAYATPSDFQFGSNDIYEDPYPSGQVGPIYDDSPELLKEKEDHLQQYLTFLFGEGDYTLQYDEAFSIQSPSYTKDDLTVYGTPWGVNISVPADTPLTELTVKELSENPILEAALRFTGIQTPVIQQRITYEAAINPTEGAIKDYRYTVTEAWEYPSAILTLCKAVSITYNPQTSYLRIGITSTAAPTWVGTTEIPTGVDLMEAVGDCVPPADRYVTAYVECYYSSQVVLGYYVPCYRVYIHNGALTAQYGIPTYTVYNLCNADFATNRTEVLPWTE